MNDTTPEVWIGARVLVEDAWEDEAGSLHDAFATVIAVDDDEVRLRFEETVVRKFYGDEAKGAQFSLDQLTRVDDTTPAVNDTCEATCNVPSHVETYGHGGHHCHLKKGHESTPGYEMHDPKIGTCKWPAVKADEERCAYPNCKQWRESNVHDPSLCRVRHEHHKQLHLGCHPFVSEQTAPVVETERITHVAILYDEVPIIEPIPASHFGIAKMYPQYDGLLKDPNKQGFYTSRLRFVDRKEAKQIALAAGQVVNPISGSESLFSEELWTPDLPSPSVAPVETEAECIRCGRSRHQHRGDAHPACYDFIATRSAANAPETARQRAHRLLDELIDHHRGTHESSFACFRVVCSDAEPLSNAIQAAAREEVRNGKAE